MIVDRPPRMHAKMIHQASRQAKLLVVLSHQQTISLPATIVPHDRTSSTSSDFIIHMAQRAFNSRKNSPHNCSRQEIYCSRGADQEMHSTDLPNPSRRNQYEDRGQVKKTNAQSYTVHLISKSSLNHPYCPH